MTRQSSYIIMSWKSKIGHNSCFYVPAVLLLDSVNEALKGWVISVQALERLNAQFLYEAWQPPLLVHDISATLIIQREGFGRLFPSSVFNSEAFTNPFLDLAIDYNYVNLLAQFFR